MRTLENHFHSLSLASEKFRIMISIFRDVIKDVAEEIFFCSIPIN